MSSSAIYRLVSSRDELFTALIVESYASVAEVVEQADRDPGRSGAGCGRPLAGDLPGRSRMGARASPRVFPALRFTHSRLPRAGGCQPGFGEDLAGALPA